MSLRKERQKAGQTQKQLADTSGVSIRMVQYYEQGFKDINHAKPITIFRLANALKTQAYKIVSDKELIKEMKRERKL